MRFLFLVFLLISFATQSIAQAPKDLEAKRIISPWGYEDTFGADPIAETLISRKQRKDLHYYFYQQELLGSIAKQKDSETLSKITGHVLKGTGRALDAGSGYVADFAGGTNPTGLLYGGLLEVGGAVIGGAIEDYGQYVLDEADKRITARLAMVLHEKYGEVIRPDGTLNPDQLRNIGETEIARTFRDPKLKEELGLELLIDLKTTATIDMLELSLKDNEYLKAGVDKLDAELKELDKAVGKVINLQKSTRNYVISNGKVIAGVDTKVTSTQKVVETLARKNLPPKQILDLYEAGALTLDAETIKNLERQKTAKQLQSDFKDASTFFSSTAVALSALGVDPEFAAATQNFGNLLAAGGAFAAAVTIGEPLSIFQTGAGLLSSIGSFFGKKSSGEGKALQAIFRELRQLSKLIQEQHQQQMEALRQIGLKIQDIEFTLNRRFDQLGFELAFLQLDTRELLFDDVRVCERLVEEFYLGETQELLQRGLIGFDIWITADSRLVDYARCLEGLANRLSVRSEADYSSVLRAAGTGDLLATARLDRYRQAIRTKEQVELQPTVSFIQNYAEQASGEVAASKLFRPYFLLCDVEVEYGQKEIDGCTSGAEFWTPSNIPFSTNNPGHGAFLGKESVLLLANFARQVAPWNGILRENTSRAVPRVISDSEIRSTSKLTASRRTRHLIALNNAIDALDLNIGQSQVIGGVPALPFIVKQLDEKIVPAYFKARIKGNPKELNALLDPPFVNRNRTGPDCTAGSDAWNALCIMEANPLLAQNAVRLLLATRLRKNGFTEDDWRSAVRSPFSDRISQLVGQDLIFEDAAADLDNSLLGLWAIELPKVYWDTRIPWNEGEEIQTTSCWSQAVVPRHDPSDDKFGFYKSAESGRCYLIDDFRADRFDALKHEEGYAALVTERTLVSELLSSICASNTNYPQRYCVAVSKPLQLEPEN